MSNFVTEVFNPDNSDASNILGKNVIAKVVLILELAPADLVFVAFVSFTVDIYQNKYSWRNWIFQLLWTAAVAQVKTTPTSFRGLPQVSPLHHVLTKFAHVPRISVGFVTISRLMSLLIKYLELRL